MNQIPQQNRGKRSANQPVAVGCECHEGDLKELSLEDHGSCPLSMSQERNVPSWECDEPLAIGAELHDPHHIGMPLEDALRLSFVRGP